jgi:hypothetical protein
MLQNEDFSYRFLRVSSPWLKKILNFDDLKCSRMKDFSTLGTAVKGPRIMDSAHKIFKNGSFVMKLGMIVE